MTTDIKWTHIPKTAHSVGLKARVLGTGNDGKSIWIQSDGFIDAKGIYEYTSIPHWRDDIQVGDLVTWGHGGFWVKVTCINPLKVLNPMDGNYQPKLSEITAYAKVVKP